MSFTNIQIYLKITGKSVKTIVKIACKVCKPAVPLESSLVR